MKRFTILLLSLMTLGMYAQTPISISTDFTVEYGTGYPKGEQVLFEPDNYDTDMTEIAGVWTAGTAEDKATYKVIVNPAKGGINTSAKCLEVTCRNNDGSIGINFENILGYIPDLNGRRRISMLFKAGKNGETPLGNKYYTQLQLETNYGTEGNQVYCLGAYYDAIDNDEAGHDGWKRLYFDFTPYNIIDNNSTTGYHPYVIGDFPYQLVFKPKICKATIGSDNRTITWHEPHTCSPGDVYYIDDIRIEDVPYAEGYWINDDTNLPKGRKIWHDAEQYNEWNTASCALPKNGSNGVLHLSGTWLKGENLVNPEIWEKGVVGTPWVYEFNEYRDLSWHVKPGDVKLMVFHKDSKLRWGDRGGLLGTNTAGDVEQGYPARFINNLNVLIFAEKSCILPDEVDNLGAHWHDTNAVVHYGSNVWKTWDLELTDDYPFLNPQQFTVQNTIKLNRTMKRGFNTITYPFYVTAAELQSARVGSLYFGMNDENLLFVTASQTEPNVPYITDKFMPLYDEDLKINVTENYQQINLSAEREVHTVDENYTGYSSDATSGKLYGTYKRISGENMWAIVTNGSWQGFMKGGPDSTIKPFRGYLTVLPNAASAGARSLSILDDDATGMGTGMVNGIETVETIHDLQGRAIKAGSLSSLPKGIYIINGKKTMIK